MNGQEVPGATLVPQVVELVMNRTAYVLLNSGSNTGVSSVFYNAQPHWYLFVWYRYLHLYSEVN